MVTFDHFYFHCGANGFREAVCSELAFLFRISLTRAGELWRLPAALPRDLPHAAPRNTHRAISVSLLLARRALFNVTCAARIENSPPPPKEALLAKWHTLRIEVAEAASRLGGNSSKRWSILRSVPSD
jgi:hypothetical protein